jgi:acyl-CoA thioesterase YciA
MVTVSIDTCNFEKPAKESQLLKIYAYPIRVGTSSVTIYVEARAHNVRNSKQSVILKTNITFVHIDEDGNSIPIHSHSRDKINNLIELEKVSNLVGSN